LLAIAEHEEQLPCLDEDFVELSEITNIADFSTNTCRNIKNSTSQDGSRVCISFSGFLNENARLKHKKWRSTRSRKSTSEKKLQNNPHTAGILTKGKRIEDNTFDQLPEREKKRRLRNRKSATATRLKRLRLIETLQVEVNELKVKECAQSDQISSLEKLVEQQKLQISFLLAKVSCQ